MREGQAKVLSHDELKRVYAVAAASRNGNRDVCIIDFSFRLGLRVKEIAALMLAHRRASAMPAARPAAHLVMSPAPRQTIMSPAATS